MTVLPTIPTYWPLTEAVTLPSRFASLTCAATKFTALGSTTAAITSRGSDGAGGIETSCRAEPHPARTNAVAMAPTPQPPVIRDLNMKRLLRGGSSHDLAFGVSSPI